MKQFWIGLSVFVAVGVAGFLSYLVTSRFDENISAERTRLETSLGYVARTPSVKKQKEGKDLLIDKDVSAERTRSEISLGFLTLMTPRFEDRKEEKDLLKALTGSDFTQGVKSSEIECRDRMRELGIVITSGPCTDVSDIVDHLAKGTYSFNKPTTAYVGESFTLRLILRTADFQDQDIARSFTGLPGEVKQQPGQFAQSVEATLVGDDFEVKPAGPQPRTATLIKPVEWEWNLKPTSGGTKTVTIEVAANIQVGTDKHRVQINTLHELIIIQVSVLQRLKSYVADANGFVLAAAALATPLAALIGFVPKVRQFFKHQIARLSRRPNRITRDARNLRDS
jgi:hypothetical protein